MNLRAIEPIEHTYLANFTQNFMIWRRWKKNVTWNPSTARLFNCFFAFRVDTGTVATIQKVANNDRKQWIFCKNWDIKINVYIKYDSTKILTSKFVYLIRFYGHKCITCIYYFLIFSDKCVCGIVKTKLCKSFAYGVLHVFHHCDVDHFI